MIVLLTALLLLLGALFILLAAIGVLRMPDLFTRMQASAKAGTFGIGLVIAAVAVHFGELGVTTRAVLVIAFFVLTNPVAAQMIIRAAFLSGVPFWKGTEVNELDGVYGAAVQSQESGIRPLPDAVRERQPKQGTAG